MEKLLDNSVRGKRALLWIKVFLVFSGLLLALCYGVYRLAGQGLVNGENADSASLWVLFLSLGFVLSIFLWLGIVFVSATFWLLWFFRAAENMRKLQPSSVSPWLASFLCCIPVVGAFVDYFVLKSLAKRLQLELVYRNVEFVPVTPKFLNAFLGMFVVGNAFLCVRDANVFPVFGMALCLGSVVCCVRFMEEFIRNENALFGALGETALKHRVDEILRDREFLAQASDMQKATPPMDVASQDFTVESKDG